MDILVVFLLLTGVILLTGASIASVIRATGSGVARHDAHGAQAARARAAPAPRAARARSAQRRRRGRRPRRSSLTPPEPDAARADRARDARRGAARTTGPTEREPPIEDALAQRRPTRSEPRRGGEEPRVERAREARRSRSPGVGRTPTRRARREQLTPQGRLRGAGHRRPRLRVAAARRQPGC